jgi:hypothetical protein
MKKRRGGGHLDGRAEPVFVNILRSSGIDAESIPLNRFMGFLNVCKYGLSWIKDSWADTQEIFTIVHCECTATDRLFVAALTCKKIEFYSG